MCRACVRRRLFAVSSRAGVCRVLAEYNAQRRFQNVAGLDASLWCSAVRWTGERERLEGSGTPERMQNVVVAVVAHTLVLSF